MSIEGSLRSRLTCRAEWKARIDMCHNAEPLMRLYEDGDRLREQGRDFFTCSFPKAPKDARIKI